MMRRLAIACAALLLLATLALEARAGGSDAPRVRSGRWTEETIALFERLPLQDGGRIKPVHTYAGFTLLRLNGKRSVANSAGDRLLPVEWLLDTLFFPEQAADHAAFLVQDAEVLEAIGITIDGRRKRDRYSFREIEPGIQRLFTLAHEYGAIEAQRRSSVQQQVVFLAGSVDAFGRLATELDFARVRIVVPAGSALATLLGGRAEARFSDVVARGAELAVLHRKLAAQAGSNELGALTEALRGAAILAEKSQRLALFPPLPGEPADAAWSTAGELFERALGGAIVAPEHLALVRGFEALADASDRDAAFASALAGTASGIEALASARGATRTIGLELAFYKGGFLATSLYLFVLAFLLTAVLWLRPRTRSLYVLACASAAGATLFLCAAIVLRCLIRGRPPVSTLYETVIFVTAVGVLVGLFLESLDRRRIALSAAAAFGMVGVFLANGYETLDKQDTMPSLVAVLDTNFWLATHVTAITIGYSAGLFAALLASVYLVLKLVRPRTDASRTLRPLARMVYGVLCFGLIFSAIGTILGGIWANESWGRFWGWDPKENGALLIVLSQIAILHGRLSGRLRDHGICMAAAFGGTVIAFSWWGVNLLGVGLHSYGFTSGIHGALWSYYYAQWGIVALGALGAWRARGSARARRPIAHVAAGPVAGRALHDRAA